MSVVAYATITDSLIFYVGKISYIKTLVNDSGLVNNVEIFKKKDAGSDIRNLSGEWFSFRYTTEGIHRRP